MLYRIWSALKNVYNEALEFFSQLLNDTSDALEHQSSVRIAEPTAQPRFVEPPVKPRNFWYVPVSGSSMGIEKGEFKGDCEKAISDITAFCQNNTVTMSSSGWGYGSVTINGERYGYNPYGIDINMMLRWCKLQAPENAQKPVEQTAQVIPANEPFVESYKTRTRKPKEAPQRRVSLDRACKAKAKKVSNSF